MLVSVNDSVRSDARLVSRTDGRKLAMAMMGKIAFEDSSSNSKLLRKDHDRVNMTMVKDVQRVQLEPCPANELPR